MNGNQMMLILLAGTLLSVLVINVNGSILNSAEVTSENEFLIAANSVGKKRISEIAAKAFDEVVTDGKRVTRISNFTSPNNLGHSAGELRRDFNDIDDFNNFTDTVLTPRAGEFTISSAVSYVRHDNLDSTVTECTRVKRVEVRVSSPFLEDEVVMYHYASY